MTSTTDESQAQQPTPQPSGGSGDYQDPVTGTTDNATGNEQAEENEERDPVG